MLEPPCISTESTTVTAFRNSASQFPWYLSLKLALEFGFFFFFSQELVVKTFTSTTWCRALGRLAEDVTQPIHAENPNKSRGGDMEPRNLSLHPDL